MVKKRKTKIKTRKCLRRAKTIKKGHTKAKCLRWAKPKTAKRKYSSRKRKSSSSSCRDSNGDFVPVPQCVRRRR